MSPTDCTLIFSIVLYNTVLEANYALIHSFIYNYTALGWALAHFFSFVIQYTFGKTPWTRDQLPQSSYLHTEQQKH